MPREILQLVYVARAVKCDSDHLILHKSQYVSTGLEVKRGFRENRFASKKGLSDVLRDVDSPKMMLIILAGEGHNEAGIGDGLHERENPLREETSAGPPGIQPAWRK